MTQNPPFSIAVKRRWFWLMVAVFTVLSARSLRAGPLTVLPVGVRRIEVVVEERLGEQGVLTKGEQRALEKLDAIVSRRPDVVEAFSGTKEWDVVSVLIWATSNNDSDGVVLVKYRPEFRRIQFKLQTLATP